VRPRAPAGQLELESLALPRIAAGPGGLTWEDVAGVLETELASVPYVEVWALSSQLDRGWQPSWRKSSYPARHSAAGGPLATAACYGWLWLMCACLAPGVRTPLPRLGGVNE